MIPVVILAAGGGKRLGEVGKLFNKALLPVGDGPLLSHHFRNFSSIGADEFILVTDPASPELEKEARRLAAGAGLSVVHQAERRGIGHAALLAEPWLKGRPFVLVLGDTYYSPKDLSSPVKEISGGGPGAVLSVRRVEDEAEILKECTIELGPDNSVRRIIEKPKKVLSMVKPCGVYFFGPRFIEVLKNTPPSALRGEIELTDAIQGLIAGGARVTARETLNLDVNITYPADILKANLAWLRENGAANFTDPGADVDEGAVLEDSVVSALASVGAGSRLVRTVVFPCASVPAGVSLSDTLVLPGLEVPLSAAAS